MGARPDALTTAIDAAWRVFDSPAPTTTGVCVHCCMDPMIEEDFLKRTARNLPSAYVREWYNGAYDGSITHDHVAWFLPRVMEMLAAGEDVAVVGHQVVFQRMRASGYPDRWSASEVSCVQGFASAFFAALLADEIPKADTNIDSWLCMFGQGGIDIHPLLQLMDELPDDVLADRLHRMWWHSCWGSISIDAFWDEGPAMETALAWYTSPRLLDRMERAAMAGNLKALDIHSVIASTRANEGL